MILNKICMVHALGRAKYHVEMVKMKIDSLFSALPRRDGPIFVGPRMKPLISGEYHKGVLWLEFKVGA